MPKKKKIDVQRLLTGGKARTIQEPYPHGTQSLVPVERIKDGIICTKDGRHVKILEVLPVNFHLKSPLEQETMIYYFASYLKITPDSLQILVRTQHADIDAYCANMEACYNREENQNCKEMILETAQTVNRYVENEAVSRRFYLAFSCAGQSEDFPQIANELEEKAETARQYLERCGLEVLRLEDEDQALFDLFASIYHRPKLKKFRKYQLDSAGSDMPDSQTEAVGCLTTADLLAPDIIDTQHPGYIIVNGVYHAYLFIAGYGYPTQNNFAWLSPLLELGDGVSVSFYADRRRREEVLPKIAQKTRWNRSRLKEVEDTRTDYENLDDAVNSGLYIKEEMNRNNEDFWYLHTLIEVTAESEEALKQRLRTVENACASIDLLIRFAHCKQEQAFLSMLPLAWLDKDLEIKSRRNALTTAVAGAFPFTSYELCDDTGVFLGINQFNDTATILDFYDRDKYSSGNIAVFGQTGAGKTFLLLLLAMRLRMLGVKVFMITPEKGFEYRSSCEAIGGQYFKIAPGSDDQINLMEIRRTTLDIDSETEGIRNRNDSVLLYGMIVRFIAGGIQNTFGGTDEPLFTLNPISNILTAVSPTGLGIALLTALLAFVFSKRGQNILSGYKTVFDKDRKIEILPEGTHGTSGWLDKAALQKRLEVGNIRQLASPIMGKLSETGTEDYVGIPDTQGMSRNIMVYGSPGTGKSRGFVMPFIMQAVKRQESLVICDPKAEFYEMYSEYLRNEGYFVRSYNLLDLEASDG